VERQTGARNVIVGVSGSIAAYKAPSVIRLLRREGHEVRTVATEAALRFIGAPALAAVTGRPVSTGVFDDPAAVEHVEMGEWAELVVVAPASADLLARLAAGRADDLLTATILMTTAPVVLAPAMHTRMWTSPATEENVATLRRRGVSVIPPDAGPLTGGDSGAGRLPEPGRIVSAALAILGAAGDAVPIADAAGSAAGSRPPQDLAGRALVVSAGGTREPLDPVRFLGNRSSGRQGCAIAAEAVRRGARTVVVAANVDAHVLAGLEPEGVRVIPVGTALELGEAVRGEAAQADAVIMTAAVADYRPATVSASKIKKRGMSRSPDCGATPARRVIELVENPDVLTGLVADPPRRGLLVVGFAAETGDAAGDVLAHGAAKARRKGADLLAVNAVGARTGFGDVPNSVVVLDSDGREVVRAAGSKAEVARTLVDLVARVLDARVQDS